MTIKPEHLFLNSSTQETNLIISNKLVSDLEVINNQDFEIISSVNQGSSLINSTITTSPDVSKTLTLKAITTSTTIIPYRGGNPPIITIPQYPDIQDPDVWGPGATDAGRKGCCCDSNAKKPTCGLIGPTRPVGCSNKSGGCAGTGGNDDKEIFYINPEDLPQLKYGDDGLALPGQDWFLGPTGSPDSAEGIYRAMLVELNKNRRQEIWVEPGETLELVFSDEFNMGAYEDI